MLPTVTTRFHSSDFFSGSDGTICTPVSIRVLGTICMFVCGGGWVGVGMCVCVGGGWNVGAEGMF